MRLYSCTSHHIARPPGSPCELQTKLLKEGYEGDNIGGNFIGFIKGDTRSLDHGSYDGLDKLSCGGDQGGLV